MNLEASDQAQDDGASASQPELNAPTSLLPPPPSSSSRFTAKNVEYWRLLDAARRSSPSDVPDAKGKARDVVEEGRKAWDQWDQRIGFKEPSTRLQWQSRVLAEHASNQAHAEASGSGQAPEEEEAEQHQKPPLPDFDVLLEMDPPRVDWIEEDGSYLCFGDRWPIPTVYPNLKQMGAKQLFPDGPIDRRQVLLTLLRTYLVTYQNLLSLLTRPPRDRLVSVAVPQLDQPPDPTTGLPTTQEVEMWKSEAQENWDFMADVVRNMQHVVNEARPGQARENALSLLRAQLQRRRAETARLREESRRTRERLQEVGRQAGRDALAAPGLDLGGGKMGADAAKGKEEEGGDVEMRA